jgi:flagellar biosynthesis protein FliP
MMNFKMKQKFSKISKIYKIFCLVLIVLSITLFSGQKVLATEAGTTEGETLNTSDDSDLLGITISTDSQGVSSALQIVLVLTVIALCPSILIMLTSFTRILIVLHFTRSALGTQTAPPNQILVGISLFLTIFIMSPVFNEIYQDAYIPFSNEEMSQEEFLDTAITPIRTFMFNQVDDTDLDSMCQIAGITSVSTRDDIPTTVLIPAFIISELRIAFFIGFLIYIPFLVIDMVVSSVLMSMGMMMLPPTTISMPFKILLFVLADGWNLIIVNLVQTFKF